MLKAVDTSAHVVALEFDAADETAAREAAGDQGYKVLTVSRKGLAFRPRLPAAGFPTALFSIELLALLDAGLNVVEALQTLAQKEPRGNNRRTLLELFKAIRQGESFSDAATHFPDAFSPLYIAIIRSSERTGNLGDALRRYIAYQEQLDKVRKKALAALIYPAILVVVGSLAMAFLMFYVVPRFARVYEDIAVPLPFFSRITLTVGTWFDRYPLLIAGALAAIAVAAVYAATRTRCRAAMIDALWRAPAIGNRLKTYELARLYRTVGMLLKAGIPVIRALEMVKGLLPGNLRGALDEAIARVASGEPLSKALTAVGLATPVATRMMIVGERTGHMAELMDRVAKFHDDETARFVDRFSRVLEPLLMAALGLAVGLVVVLMYMPIFELAGALQ
jgi:general secretion pathway protein F